MRSSGAAVAAAFSGDLAYWERIRFPDDQFDIWWTARTDPVVALIFLAARSDIDPDTARQVRSVDAWLRWAHYTELSPKSIESYALADMTVNSVPVAAWAGSPWTWREAQLWWQQGYPTPEDVTWWQRQPGWTRFNEVLTFRWADAGFSSLDYPHRGPWVSPWSARLGGMHDPETYKRWAVVAADCQWDATVADPWDISQALSDGIPETFVMDVFKAGHALLDGVAPVECIRDWWATHQETGWSPEQVIDTWHDTWYGDSDPKDLVEDAAGWHRFGFTCQDAAHWSEANRTGFFTRQGNPASWKITPDEANWFQSRGWDAAKTADWWAEHMHWRETTGNPGSRANAFTWFYPAMMFFERHGGTPGEWSDLASRIETQRLADLHRTANV